jgi:lipoate-protein ligase A
MPFMRYLDLTLPTPEENLALDEALLEEAERAGRPTETLRLWEPAEPMVVVGRSSRIEAEVHRDACRRRGIPILRRPSGGAAVVTGPGCLMYALVLSYRLRPELRMIDHAHRFVLGRIASALRPLVPEVTCQGTSDLAVDALKFSGNSVRCKRDHFLYHGTILYDFPLDLIAQCLATPPRQPDYRSGRTHDSFVTNLPLPPDTIRAALVAAWNAGQPYIEWPRAATRRLAAEKYNRPEWNERR